MTNPLVHLQALGQSPWHDNIRRSQLTSGLLAKMVKAGDITGLTSNPTIFEQAFQSTDYDEAIMELARKGRRAEEIYDVLSIEDIRAAADVFAPVYKRTQGVDGYVSIEVAPKFAHDTDATIAEAKRLWKAVNRPNLMVKIPATLPGLPAITACLAEGLNINVTLIFSVERHREVMAAYLAGLEQRLAAGKKIDGLASVASFFVSRVDTLVDKQLDEKIKAMGGEAVRLRKLKGKAAIANSRLAYAEFRQVFGSERFARLAEHGARVQRPLWASTSTKNPAYPDVYYVEALIGPDTVDTMPPATIVAYKHHGQPEARLEKDSDSAPKVFEQLEAAGIHMSEVTQKLEDDGVASFAKSFDAMMVTLDSKREAALLNARQKVQLGKWRKPVDATVAKMDAAQLGQRLWKKDPTLWKPDDAAHQAEIRIRLGWLDVVELMQTKITEMTTFAGEVKRAGFTHAVLCGMGGSSLAPEVLRETLGIAKGYLDLAVLDSTDPSAVLDMAGRSDPARTLYIIASKSGSTTEPNAFFQFFWKHVRQVKGERAGENFVAITDPGTVMEKRAQDHKFRRIFLNPPEIGGRFSALSFFGLVPAALMGMDVAQLLDRAARMMRACGAQISAAQNPGLYLGAVMGTLALAGCDKLTLVTSDKICTLSYWLEQLVAESTGKENLGIVPVEGEPVGAPDCYGKDRYFVYLRLNAKHDAAVAALAEAGFPVIELRLADAYDVAAEFIRWEIATAVVGWVLKIDPFDQPNVQAAKDNTKQLLVEHQAKGKLPEVSVALSPETPDFGAKLLKLLKTAKRGDYVALTAYVERTPRREKLLRELQAAILAQYQVPTTIGYGPRFLHSTGQLHKGGANNGVFIQFLCEDPVDAPVPDSMYTFSVLKAAQALGDYQALVQRQRRAARVNLGDNVEAGLKQMLDVVAPKPAPKKKVAKRR
jgi:transaldolase / glucose-6-phosphate isomerase